MFWIFGSKSYVLSGYSLYFGLGVIGCYLCHWNWEMKYYYYEHAVILPP